MTAHDDRARDERQAADELTAHDQEQGLYDEQHAPVGCRCAGMDEAPGCTHSDEQPAPTAHETAADELAEAERDVRQFAATGAHPGRPAVARVMDEYDARGRERDAARAEVERLRGELDELRAEDHELHGAYLKLRARVRDLEAGREVEQHALRVAALRISELERRDEAAEAFVRAWLSIPASWRDTAMDAIGEPVEDALDELVRVRREGEQ